MDEKIARRTAITALGSAILANSGCFSKSTETSNSATGLARIQGISTPRINLICHGMMIFWRNRSRRYDGIEITIPRTNDYATPGSPDTHELKLSLHPGGEPNLMKVAGRYELTLPTTPKADFKDPEPMSDVVFYDANNKTEITQVSDRVRSTLAIPYPTRVASFRSMMFPIDAPAFVQEGMTGMGTYQVAKTFNVKPETMGGVHVLTYEYVPDPNGKFPELKIGSTDLLGLTAQPHILNIHLYSQALTATKTMVMTGKAHIDYINEMLQYGPNKAPFDLAVNNKEPDHIELGGEPVPPDLSQTDLTALYEFGAPINPSKNFLLTDPAECLQGWAS